MLRVWLGVAIVGRTSHRGQSTGPEVSVPNSKSAGPARPLGTRILPVYVFSLLLPAHLQNALLDRNFLYTAYVERPVSLSLSPAFTFAIDAYYSYVGSAHCVFL
jgi:hypothetical protein